MSGQSDVLEVVLALYCSGGCACLLNRGQDECHERRDDGNHHEQFDERETATNGFLGKLYTTDLHERDSLESKTFENRERPENTF